MTNYFMRKKQKTTCYDDIEFDTTTFDNNGPFNIYIPKRGDSRQQSRPTSHYGYSS